MFYCVSKLLSPRADQGVVVKCGRSLEDVSEIASFDWCGYIINELRAVIVNVHKKLDQYRSDFKGLIKPNFKVTGCFSLIIFGIIHGFRCGNYNFSLASRPYVSSWDSEERLNNVIEYFGNNIQFAVAVTESKVIEKVVEKVVEKDVSKYVSKVVSKVKNIGQSSSSSPRQLSLICLRICLLMKKLMHCKFL